MSQIQIAVIVGSLRRESFNRKLAEAVVKLAPPEFSFRQVPIGDLPLYSQDDDGSPAAAVTRLKADLAASQGFLFCRRRPNFDHPCRLNLDQGWKAARSAAVCG